LFKGRQKGKTELRTLPQKESDEALCRENLNISQGVEPPATPEIGSKSGYVKAGDTSYCVMKNLEYLSFPLV